MIWTFATPFQLSTPASPNDHPEIDETNYLDGDLTSLYQSYVGIYNGQWNYHTWICVWVFRITMATLSDNTVNRGVLSDMDMAFTALTRAKFMTAPCEGHLIGLLHAFDYTKKHMNS